MKKLILGMMLVTVFLSFSKDRDKGVDRHDFDNNKSLSNDSDNGRVDYFDDLVFNNKRSLSNDRNRGVDRQDFDDFKLRRKPSYNKEELKRKREVMLNNMFDN
ncbi:MULTISPECIES: hypothetical protein [Psychrilyobacter]|uniref:Uncharacterized protein n=1 Tax=Psychrilyobacter piezotolerans TaxID=2293438 RepID=A0ABX9KG94_9FUSO|nr:MULTISPECIES: hypothetical protein [Psychrilyobacter]MCS5420964.1 hypothetical protein [Psychrilyobacter sp. S5]NDI78286.1 hypothetical protein [Psychrilyobacter piezotolerans]RDE60864.1 hypothetical protein DV867_10125 [Psychrilyobacter sp. S5]REI40653.1 hypothetical protein DYH56_10125 [Psychrilyobacter piezotolerans]